MKVYKMGQWGYVVYHYARRHQMRRAENLNRKYTRLTITEDVHEKAPNSTNQDTAA